MNQEDYNEMMRYPGETYTVKVAPLRRCPKCGEPYCGDGVIPCTECAARGTVSISESVERAATEEDKG